MEYFHNDFHGNSIENWILFWGYDFKENPQNSIRKGDESDVNNWALVPHV